MNPFIENQSPSLEFAWTPADNWNISDFLASSSAENRGMEDRPIAQISISHSPMQVENRSSQFLLEHVTSCGYQINRDLKKRISNIRNKNTDYSFRKIDDKYVRKTFDNLTKAMVEKKEKDDLTKSLNYFFIQLALIRGYGSMESLYQVFNHNQTIKKNARTRPSTEDQQKIISVQMQFYKEVAKQFAQDPRRGVLKAYLRNHNENSLRKGKKLDRMTHEALIQTLQTLNSAPFNYKINLSLPEYQIEI